MASFFRLLRRLFLSVVLLAVVCGGIAAALAYRALTASLPPIDQLAQYRPPAATQVLADDGTLIGEFYVEKRYVVPIDRIPLVVRNAFIAAEDDNFYRHEGVDLTSMLRAFLNNTMGRGSLQGGSTITQQVVKSLLLTPQRSYERKIKEVILAVRLEQELSKDQILELYLNHIYLGGGAYGVAAASQEYFGKSVEAINVAEAAILAGLPQAPSRYSPVRHWRRAKNRQQYVLRRMMEAGFITPDEMEAALRQPIALAPRKGNYIAAPYYVEHVRRLLEERYGADKLTQLGLRVYTAANVRMSGAAETALRAGLDTLHKRQGGGTLPVRHLLTAAEVRSFLEAEERNYGGQPLQIGHPYEAVVTEARKGRIQLHVGAAAGLLDVDGTTPSVRVGEVYRIEVAAAEADGLYRFQLDPQPTVQGALIALEAGSGQVKAMVGGYDFNRSHFNRAVQAARQPGSAFKPLIYAAALERRYTPASIIVDELISFRDNDGWWTPKNFEDKYFGPTTLRDALTFSRNVVTVKLTNSLGLPYVIRYIQNLGIQSPLKRNLSLALGSSEVNLLELATAYSVFLNHGRWIEPVFITRIVNQNGETIFADEPHVRDAIPASTAYQITSMLESAIERGTGRRAKDLRRPAAGKTGTTNDFMDAWFMGYTPQLLAGVWVGFDEKRDLGEKETGGKVATPIWLDFMRQATEGMPIEDFQVPQDIILTPVDSHTGNRAAPGEGGAIIEAFRRGTEPVEAPVVAAEAAADTAARDFFRYEE